QPTSPSAPPTCSG
nr:immunoglobulin heavy chain junction region [Homo sapiens]